MTTNDNVLVPRDLNRATITAVLHEVLDEYDERLCAGAFDEIVDRLAAAPQPAEHADCCDTPAYCSSVRRCTRKDAARPDDGEWPLLRRLETIASYAEVRFLEIHSSYGLQPAHVTYVPETIREAIDAISQSQVAAPVAQPAEGGLPGLPEAAVMTQLGREAYTADQMLAFRAEGIAHAQQRSAAVFVDEAAIERARTAYAKVKRYYTGDFPEGSIRSIVDMNRNDDAAWTAAITAALNRKEG